MPESTDVAFIVHIRISDVSIDGLAASANDINHALITAGLDVLDVEPWQRPTVMQPGALAPQPPPPNFNIGPTPPASLF